MFDELSDEQRIILISCAYFRGLWTIPFEEHRTKERIFHAPSGDGRRPFMHLEGHLAYFEDKNIQAISLSYGSCGGLMCMSFHEKRSGTLALPRFRIERSIQLNETLQAAGIRRAFDPKESDFRGMIREPDPAWIGAARQNTFLEVDEKGTEAAAATWLDVECQALEEPPRLLLPLRWSLIGHFCARSETS